MMEELGGEPSIIIKDRATSIDEVSPTTSPEARNDNCSKPKGNVSFYEISMT